MCIVLFYFAFKLIFEQCFIPIFCKFSKYINIGAMKMKKFEKFGMPLFIYILTLLKS